MYNKYILNLYFQDVKNTIACNSVIEINQKTLADYYMTNSVSRASPTMAKCVAAVKKQSSV